ncbi:hypothetical protein D3C71_1493050 [compost metagenome]
MNTGRAKRVPPLVMSELKLSVPIDKDFVLRRQFFHFNRISGLPPRHSQAQQHHFFSKKRFDSDAGRHDFPHHKSHIHFAPLNTIKSFLRMLRTNLQSDGRGMLIKHSIYRRQNKVTYTFGSAYCQT